MLVHAETYLGNYVRTFINLLPALKQTMVNNQDFLPLLDRVQRVRTPLLSLPSSIFVQNPESRIPPPPRYDPKNPHQIRTKITIKSGLQTKYYG